MKKFKSFLYIMLIIIIIGIMGGTIVNSMQLVDLQTRQQPTINIVLTKNKSNVDISNFEKDLKAELENQNVNPNRVNVQEIETENFSSNAADAADILSKWGRVGLAGNWYYSGNEVINSENTGGFTGFYYPDNFNFDDIDYTYENTSSDRDDDIMGSMFRFNVNENGTVSTYLLLLNKRDNTGGFAPDNGLYKITNAAFAEGSIRFLQRANTTWSRYSWSKYHIVAKGNNIKIYQNDNLIIDYTDQDPIYTGSYGIFSCSQPNARYRNIGITTTNYKDFLSVLEEASWQDNATRLVVNVEDEINENLEDEQFLTQAVARLLSQDIHYVGWGTSANAEQIQNIVNKNDDKGTFVDNTNYEQAIKDTATYIKNLLASYPTSQTLIINEPIDMQVTPEEVRNNTTNAAYPNGKWKAVHDETYYENSNGKYINSGNFQDAVMEEFDKVGKYDIYFEDQHIKELYLHRRPVAIITSKIEENTLTLSSEKSYDLDKQSVYNGIEEEKWFYKTMEDEEWTEGKLTTIEDETNYLVKLIVKDYQDAWSKEAVQYISTSATKPISQFELIKNEITVYENLQIIDTSYDPAGKEIIEHNWKLYKDDEEQYTGTEAPVNYMEYGEGTYKLVLTVKNSEGIESDEFATEFTVLADKIAPTVRVEPAEQTNMHENISVKLNFEDVGGSGYKGYQYALTNEKEDVPEYGDWINLQEDTIVINQNGTHYLHIKTVDNAGNESEDLVFGPYTIEEETILTQLHALDSENNQIKLGGLQYQVIEPKVNEQEEDVQINCETDATGKAEVLLNIMKTNGEYTYTIEEITAPSNYQPIGTVHITANIQNGEITSITSDNANVQPEITPEGNININYMYTKIEKPFYQFIIETVDENDENTKIKDAKYTIEMYSENPGTLYSEVVTNEAGIAQIEKISQNGEVNFVIQQMSTNNGYIAQASDIVVTIQRDENTNQITGIANKTSENAEVYIDNAKQEIRVVVANNKKEEKNYIRVQLVGEANENLQNMKIKIVQPLDFATIEAVTNEEGIATIDNMIYPGDGEFAYMIEGDENNIYDFSEKIVPITFKNQYISSVGKDENVQVLQEETEEEVQHIVYIKIQANLKTEYQVAQQFKIVKQNLQTQPLAGITYRVTIQSDNLIKTIRTQTNAQGEIYVPLWKSNKLQITVKELKTLPGYQLDTSEKNITLVAGENNQYDINAEQSIENVEKDAQTGNIVLKEINEKKAESAHKANICFFITKKDQEGNLLGNTVFKLTEQRTQKEYTLKTDANGYVELHDFAVENVGDYLFTIEEIDTTSGYTLMSTPIKLQIGYETNENGEMKTNIILVRQGYRNIEYKRCDEYETDENYQLDVHMTIINDAKPLEEGEIQNQILFEKEGPDSSKLDDTEWEMNVKFDDDSTVKVQGNVKKIQQFLQNLIIPEGTVEIELIETKAVPGYRIDTTPKVMQLINIGGKIAILEDNHNILSWEEGKLKILLQNQLINNNTGGGNITYVEETSFTLEIRNENVHNSSARLTDAVFNVKLNDVNGQLLMNKNRGTNEYDETAEFTRIYASGDLKFTIQQIRAPLHHKINDKAYTVTFHRDKNTQYIELDEEHTDQELEAVVDQINHKIIVTIKNELAYLTMGIITEDAEDTNLKLANAGYRVHKYYDYNIGDYDTFGYGVTDKTGTTMIPMYTYVTSGTTLYQISEVQVPTGYYGQAAIGMYITTDKEGNITNANTYNSENFKGECTINKIEGNYIEIIVKNTRKPEPTYRVTIEAYNEYDPKEKVGGVQFTANIFQEEGTNISTKATTGSGGIASIRGLTGKGELQINLQQVAAPAGYLLDSQTRVVFAHREVKQEVTTEGGNRYYQKLELLDKTNADVEVTVDNINQEIYIRVPCIPIAGIEIEKVDILDEDIKLQNAGFEVYEDGKLVNKVITDELGKAFIALGPTVANKTVVYQFKETKAPEGYSMLRGNVELTITYNSAGLIQEAYITSGREYAYIDDMDENGFVRIKIRNGEIEPGQGGQGQNQEKFISLEIDKQTTQNKNIRVEGITFQIRTESEDGKVLNAVKVTDEEGQIELNGIPGKGKVKIYLKEIATNDNYVLDDKERVITVVKEVVKGEEVIKLISNESATDVGIQVDERDRKIMVTIPNSISNRIIGLAIFKEDSEDELKMLEATFQVTDKETNQTYTVTTDKSKGSLVGLPLKDKGTYQYEIVETTQPAGYQKAEDAIILQVTYRQLGEIEKVEIIQGTDICRIDNQTNNYIELHVSNTAEEVDILPYDLRIVKVDMDDIDITLPEAEMYIEVSNEIGMQSLSKQDITDENGEIWIRNIRGKGKINVDIEEIVPPPGRKFDSKPKQVEINCDIETNRLKLIESLNVDTIIDNTNRLVTVLVRNELQDGLYEFTVTKKDKSNQNITLQNVHMKIKLPGEKEAREVVTDENGRIVLTNLPMPAVGEYEYTVEEIKTLEGYTLLDKPVKFKIKFTETNGKEMIQEAKITSNSENATIARTEEQYVAVEIYDEHDENYPSENLYKIKINKVDAVKTSIGIRDVKFKVTIQQNDGQVKQAVMTTNEKGEILLEGLIITDNGTIMIEERETPEGYDLDTTSKEIQYMIKDNKIVLTKIDDTIIANTDGKQVEVTIKNNPNGELTDLHPEKFVSKINDQAITETQPILTKEPDGSITYQSSTKVQNVKYNDLIEYTIRIYNNGTEDGYAGYILDKVPEGLKFVEENETNKQYGWVSTEGGYKTTILESGEENVIPGYDKNTMDLPEYKEVKIVFQVTEKVQDKNPSTKNVVIVGETEEKPTEPGGYQEDNENQSEINVEYVKLETKKFVTSVKLNGEDKNVDRQKTESGDIFKIEIVGNKVKKSTVIVQYEIQVSNTGTKAGQVTEIRDYIPSNMTFVAEDNPGWALKDNYAYMLINETLQPGQTTSRTITLRWYGNSNEMGLISNVATVNGEENIIPEQQGKSEITISVKTGTITYIALGIIILGIIGGGTYIVKKYIVTDEEKSE